MSDYENKRDTAHQQFIAVPFDAAQRKMSLDELFAKALARYDVEIGWYDKHAGRRRIWSGAVRILAVGLGGASALLLDFSAFSVGSGVTAVFGPEATAIATVLAVLAGIVLLYDLVFSITKRYTRWRVTEYRIRIMRAGFEVAYLNGFGHLTDAKIDEKVFNDAKTMAAKDFSTVLEEIKAETESWQQDLESAMTSLRQRIETTSQEARKAVEETATKMAADEREKQQKLVEEKRKQEPVILNVLIEQSDGRVAPLSLVAIDKDGAISKRITDASPGRTYPFVLPPGPYAFRLLDMADKELNAKAKRLVSEKRRRLDYLIQWPATSAPPVNLCV